MPSEQPRSIAFENTSGDVKGGRNLDLLLREAVITLSNFDFEHQHEMQRLKTSRTNPEIKKQIAASLLRQHQERRQSYVVLVAQLRKQLAHQGAELQATG